MVEPRDETRLAAGVNERMLYIRDNSTGGFEPLVTSANDEAGTKFADPLAPGPSLGYVGATPNLKHVIFQSTALTPEAGEAGENGLYEWTAGRLQLASVLPNGAPTGVGSLGGDRITRNAVSTDGARVIWTAAEGRIRHLYLRDMAKHETIELDAAQGGSGGSQEGTGTLYQTASSDGSRVFFTDSERLMENSTGSSNADPIGDLYECEVAEQAGKLTCNLTDLTADRNAGEQVGILGVVIGASEDGSYVYFVANGALAEGATPGSCVRRNVSPEHAECNLYVARLDTGGWTTTLIAKLSQHDEQAWGGGAVVSVGLLELRCAGVAGWKIPRVHVRSQPDRL